MSMYREILNWSQNRQDFIRDILRRIISKQSISESDIDEIVLLLKKENGDNSVTINSVPIDSTHIPSTIDTGISYPKLIKIENPQNICALYSKSSLQFSCDRLNIIYGNNGSGKSSYSRILKKLCWSRNTNIELKKNLFVPSSNKQQVNFIVKDGNTDLNFCWIENSSTHPSLRSIFLFDTECGDIYVNRENPTEYKPVGIDLLEKLIPVLGAISQKLDFEIAQYTTQKPNLDSLLYSTKTSQWYANIESKTRNDIDNYIQFSQEDREKKQELFNLINTNNPQQIIQNLTNLQSRLHNYFNHFENIEKLFNEQNIEEIRILRGTFEKIKRAYDIATTEMNGLNTIRGFGTNPWRTLWEAAKNFAHSNGMSDGKNFPSSESLEKCVLCQQNLDEFSKKRLEAFNKFILDDISTQLNSIQVKIEEKISTIKSLQILTIENFIELEDYIQDFRNKYNNLIESITIAQDITVKHLENGSEINITFYSLSHFITELIPSINDKIEQNKQLLHNKAGLIIEYNELMAKEFLFNNKKNILRYFDELKSKERLINCQSQLNTSIISRKIGDLMDDQAVRLQHEEFINHLKSFDIDLSSKVLLTKTRTSQGNTFQKCTLTGLNDSINSVLSEGEQKIIALSNFLAECTIDGRKNTVIFDDPVNSLDLDYRELIADKISKLSKDRQVIVFTHDLFFLRLLIDICKANSLPNCNIISIDKYNGISGIVTDEIPYLAKNVQERINSIRTILREYEQLEITDFHGREIKLDSARKRFRMLLERSVEEILSNKTYERFSKNIHLKKENLSGYVVTDKSDIDFLLSLFGKYSETEHDGGPSTIHQLPNKTEIEQDISDYSNWKNLFKSKLTSWKNLNNYN